jgi:predicted nucleic acid-binding protein
MAAKALLDTDILSELMRARNPVVVAQGVAYKTEHGRFTISVLTVLVTGNVRHYQRIRDLGYALQLSNWRETST